MRSGVVTSEAVVLDLPTAGVATRAFARTVDLVLQGVVAVALSLIGSQFVGVGASPVLVSLLVVAVVLLVLPITVEIASRGRSVGKALFGLRVVGTDGAPVRPRQATVRGLLAVVDIYLSLGFLAAISAMLSPSAQRLGDMAAATVVVRERAAGRSEVPIAFYPPPGFELYVANLDVGRLRPEDFALLREYLLRVGQFSGEVRAAESTALARGIAGRIGVEVPPTVDPQTWLVCVASAYQWRRGGLLWEVSRGAAPVRAPSGPAAG